MAESQVQFEKDVGDILKDIEKEAKRQKNLADGLKKVNKIIKDVCKKEDKFTNDMAKLNKQEPEILRLKEMINKWTTEKDTTQKAREQYIADIENTVTANLRGYPGKVKDLKKQLKDYKKSQKDGVKVKQNLDREKLEYTNHMRHLIIYAVYKQLEFHAQVLQRNTLFLKDIGQYDEKDIFWELYQSHCKMDKTDEKELNKRRKREKREAQIQFEQEEEEYEEEDQVEEIKMRHQQGSDQSRSDSDDDK